MTNSTSLPPELWIVIFHHATHVPGTLVPDIYAHANYIGPAYYKIYNTAIRDALITKRALVRVCKRWWHLAIPFLYQSVYIGRIRCLSSLSAVLAQSAMGKGTRSLGDYTRRLDIAIRDTTVNADRASPFLAAIIRSMPCLAIISFSNATIHTGAVFVDTILNALHCSAASLRVFDWSARLEPCVVLLANLLAKCTQLRILNCPELVWSKELEHGGFPPTVTTLRLHNIVPVRAPHKRIPHISPNIVHQPGPTALEELLLDLNKDPTHWVDLLRAFSSQLVSVHFYIPNLPSATIRQHVEILRQTCPNLRRLTITFERFSSIVRPNLAFPSITYLGLRTNQIQSPKAEFETLFVFLAELRSSVPPLQVVQLLNECNLRCLLSTHTKLAVRSLKLYVDATTFRLEDKEGVLLTDRLRALGHL